MADVLSIRTALIFGTAISLATFLAGTPAQAQAAQTAANAMVDRFTDAWNCSDGAAYGENYWPEAELRYPVENVLRGRSAIIQEHVTLWAGPFKGSHADAKVRGVQLLDSNHILVDFDLVISWFHGAPLESTPNSPVVKANLRHVLEKRNGVWKVVSGQNSFAAGRESITAPRPTGRTFALNQ